MPRKVNPEKTAATITSIRQEIQTRRQQLRLILAQQRPTLAGRAAQALAWLLVEALVSVEARCPTVEAHVVELNLPKVKPADPPSPVI